MQNEHANNESFEFCKNKLSQQIFAVINGRNAVDENGKPYRSKVLIRPNTSRIIIKPHEFFNRYEPLTITEGTELWNEKLKTISDIKEEQLNLITGALLPIWGKLPMNNNKVYRLKDEQEEAYLGVVIDNAHIDNFLNDLHNREAKTQTVEEHVNNILNGHEIEFANEWRITSKIIMGEARIEVLLPLDQTYMKESINELKENCQAFTEIINYQLRAFLPTNNLAQALTYLTGAYHIK